MTQAIATVPYRPADLSTERMGEVLVKSGFFQDTRDVAQAIVKVLAGRELGFGPIASMQGVYIVKGRVTLSANLVAAAIQRSGKYVYRVTDQTPECCSIDFYELGVGPVVRGGIQREKLGNSTFTMDDAKAAGLVSDTYKKFPRNMLFSRALTNGARWFCPEVFSGPVYTPDELGATLNDEGDVIDLGTGEVVEERAAPPPSSGPLMVTSVDSKLYQVYVDLMQRAARQEIEYEALGVPIERQKVLDEAKRLQPLVEAAERQPEPVA